jgi:hypothetical protein
MQTMCFNVCILACFQAEYGGYENALDSVIYPGYRISHPLGWFGRKEANLICPESIHNRKCKRCRRCRRSSINQTMLTEIIWYVVTSKNIHNWMSNICVPCRDPWIWCLPFHSHPAGDWLVTGRWILDKMLGCVYLVSQDNQLYFCVSLWRNSEFAKSEQKYPSKSH